MRPLSSFSTCVAILIGAGCANNDLADADYADLAQTIGAGLASPAGGGDVGALADSATLAQGELPPGFSRDPSGMVTGSHGDLACVYLVVCKDATGSTLDPCDPSATTAVVVGSWRGTIDMPSFTGTIRRDGMWTLDGIGGPVARVTGGSSLVTMAYFSPGLVYDVTDTKTVALSLDMATHAIMDGSITLGLDGKRSETMSHGIQDREVDVRAELAFDRAGMATLTLDGSHAFWIDLATGAVSPALVR